MYSHASYFYSNILHVIPSWLSLIGHNSFASQWGLTNISTLSLLYCLFNIEENVILRICLQVDCTVIHILAMLLHIVLVWVSFETICRVYRECLIQIISWIAAVLGSNILLDIWNNYLLLTQNKVARYTSYPKYWI